MWNCGEAEIKKKKKFIEIPPLSSLQWKGLPRILEQKNGRMVHIF